MKIDTTLATAIRAASKASYTTADNYQTKRTKQTQAIQELLDKRPHRRIGTRLKQLQMQLQASKEACADLDRQITKLLKPYGCYNCNATEFEINAPMTFTGAGGKIPTFNQGFEASTVISRVSRAPTEAEALAILAEYGIHWQPFPPAITTGTSCTTVTGTRRRKP